MRLRLAAPGMAALMAVLLPGCGEAIDDPRPADATERQVLSDAAEMLPRQENAPERSSAAFVDAETSRTD